MIHNIQITGEPDMHPEHPVHDMGELASGKLDFSQLTVKAHHIDVFDLMDAAERERFSTLYVSLLEGAKSGTTYIWTNTRELLTRPDGSTGWFKYLEWDEIDTSGILGA